MPTASALLPTLNDAADLVLKLLWPLILVVVIYRLFPSIRAIVEARGFQLKLWGAEVSVQDASNQLSRQIDDLGDQVRELRARLEPIDVAPGGTDPTLLPPAVGSTATTPRRALWVDGRSGANAYEKAKLGELGIDITEARTTSEALSLVADGSYDLVITDFGWVENGVLRPDAGLELLEALPPSLPAYVYSSTETVLRRRHALLNAGARAATASPTELIELVSGSPMGVAIALDQRVSRALQQANTRVIGEPGGTPDYVLAVSDGRVGIESRGWGDSSVPSRRRVEQVIERLEQAIGEQQLDAAIIVTPSDFSLPQGLERPSWLRLMSLERFISWLANPMRNEGESE